MRVMKRAFLLSALLAMTFLAGWIAGHGDGQAVRAALGETEVRLLLSEAKAQVLASRLSLHDLNSQASAAGLEAAGRRLRDARAAFEQLGRLEEQEWLTRALDELGQARELAGRLDDATHDSAARVLRAIEEVLQAP